MVKEWANDRPTGMPMPILRLILAAALAALPWQGPVAAQDGPAPGAEVVLTVTGLDPAEFAGGRLELDMAMLQSLGQTRITTATIWTEGTHTYTGVLVHTLATHVKAADRDLRFHALNDYSVVIPATETSEIAPLLAYAMDDAPMPVREKGPLWVIYPYDADAEFRTDITYSRSIWQLDRIDVLR
jgi:hypothetical protein